MKEAMFERGPHSLPLRPFTGSSVWLRSVFVGIRGDEEELRMFPSFLRQRLDVGVRGGAEALHRRGSQKGTAGQFRSPPQGKGWWKNQLVTSVVLNEEVHRMPEIF